MLIRKNLVEDIYHRASFFKPEYHSTTPTIGITVENLLNNGSEYRFQLKEEKDIEPCRQWVLETFLNIVTPFFIKYNSLEELDKAVNPLQGKSIFTGPKFEGNVGLILAKLVNNRHVATLHSLFWQFEPSTKAISRLETHRYIRCFKIAIR